jgi:4-azaleucine resistance transporter AzlC
VVGATPFAIIYGTLAAGSGLSFEATQAMSLFVFAGSAQFIAVGLVGAGTAWPMIVMTTLVVNLRHLLYGATLIPFIKRLSHPWKVFLSFWLTDETFAVSVKRYQEPDPSPSKHLFQLGSSLFMYINWNVWTLLGFKAGNAFPAVGEWGLDFAMPATFIGIVVPELVNRPMWAAALTAGAVSLLTVSLPHKTGLMIAALMGVAAALLCESLEKEKAGE